MNTSNTTRFPRSGAGVEAVVIPALPAVSPATRPLSAAEAKDLAICEAKILDGLDRMGKIGRETIRLLRHIHDEKLYREKFRFFKDYYQATFGKSVRRAMQLMSFDEVMEGLEEGEAALDAGAFLAEGPPRPARMLPRNEGQTRALATLPKKDRPEAWKEAQVVAGAGKQPTGKQVAEVVESRKGSPPLMADRMPLRGFSGTPGPGFVALGEAFRKRILEASQRAVVALRALQDLVMGDARNSGRCNAAVRAVEALEQQVKTGEQPTTGMEAKWMVTDALTDLTALEQMLERSSEMALASNAGRALDYLRAICDWFKVSNERLQRARGVTEDSPQRRSGPDRPPGRREVQRTDPNTVFVIHRRPIARGAVATSAKQHRYAGNPGGWTPDPNKVTPFDSEEMALEGCHKGDAVETLAQAQRRFEAVRGAGFKALPERCE